jgi:flagellar hook-length control protein FliK
MIQNDSSISSVTQILPQSQRTEQTKDSGDSEFQGLLEQKCQTAADQPKAVTKDAKKVAGQQKTEQPEEDPIARELACAELAAVDVAAVLPNFQAPEDLTAAVQQTVPTAIQMPETSAEPVVQTVEPELGDQPVTQVTQQPQQETEAPAVTEELPETAAQTTISETDGNTQAEAQKQTDVAADTREDDKGDDVTATVTEADPGAGQTVFHSVEANMIKVSDAPPAEESQETSDVDQQIADQLTTGLEQGQSKVEIKLTPSSLGNVTVEVTAQEDGSLHIALSAENPHTKVLLEQHTASLQELVSNQGQRTVQVDVTQRQDSHRDGMQNNDQGSRGGYQQQERRQQPQHDENFMQKLRLGLLPLSVEAVE